MRHTFSADVKLGLLTPGKVQTERVSERRAEVTVLPKVWRNFCFHVILIFWNVLYKILY